jgi:iron complex outermembrane receptor protein
MTLVQNRLYFTLGARFEDAPFTGFLVEPNGRLLWAASDKQTVWLAFSDVGRTPDRAHRGLDVTLGVVPPTPNGPPVAIKILGAADTGNEAVQDFEAGYRLQAARHLSIDLATFYSKYNDVQTLIAGAPFFQTDPPPPHVVVPLYFSNQMHGRGLGAEASVSWKVTSQWKLAGGYSFLGLRLDPNPGSANPSPEVPAGTSPRHQFQIRSQWDLPRHLEFDQSIYFVDKLTSLAVPAYTRVDLRFGWRLAENMELSVVGQNLLSPAHLEFVDPNADASTQDVRKAFVRMTWSF